MCLNRKSLNSFFTHKNAAAELQIIEMEANTSANIDTDAFLPPAGRQQMKTGKKRTISTSSGAVEEQMQVDETTGIEGARKTNAPKAKRKKSTAVEVRKVPVPSHRLVPSIRL